MGLRSYIAEPERGRRCWVGKTAERDAVYANRRRVRGDHGKALLRSRGELLERPFAHAHETGGMRRTHLRRHANILKRLLVHFAGLNLGLLMRTRYGIGTPRGLQSRGGAIAALAAAWWRAWDAVIAAWERRQERASLRHALAGFEAGASLPGISGASPGRIVAFTTGC